VTQVVGSTFDGFSADDSRTTPVLTRFFSEVLPAIDHLGELKVTLYAFWALSKQGGDHPHLRRSQMASDARLGTALAEDGLTGEEALDEALERAVHRRTLLRVTLSGEEVQDDLYFLNAPKGRAAMQALEAGQWRPDTVGPQVRLDQDRPSAFLLYEQNIGALTPMIAEQLAHATAEYPVGWLEEAMRIAVSNNVRKWRYIEAILEDWKTKGRDEREDRRDPEAIRRRYLGGEFAKYIKG
jgi:DNA replication protein